MWLVYYIYQIPAMWFVATMVAIILLTTVVPPVWRWNPAAHSTFVLAFVVPVVLMLLGFGILVGGEDAIYGAAGLGLALAMVVLVTLAVDIEKAAAQKAPGAEPRRRAIEAPPRLRVLSPAVPAAPGAESTELPKAA
jgi:hypothetical protein